MDKRKHYILILDTETVNGHTDEKGKLDFSDVFAYDIGYCIVDTRGAVYLERSFVNSDIFFLKKTLCGRPTMLTKFRSTLMTLPKASGYAQTPRKSVKK